ncbi:MAG: aminotransferase class I/II-fold pyridoxal phosphate-dependent enzyme, partial [Desulfobulbaceae bacterium]|nr:aminotransferase class I/II-fold pyridoxal phosphate-dependent enzyme [Desulfobulbaceae bacterium]
LIESGQRVLADSGAGSGAARLMSGDLVVHHQLEEAVASLKGKDAALLFGSGFMANAGVIPALVGRGDVVYIDRLDHASIYDGCRLSGAGLHRFRHNDLAHLEELLLKNPVTGQTLVVVESIYSMDGDRCPLAELVQLRKRYGFLLMVDEAHATGLFGSNGGGVVEADGVGDEVDLVMGTFGKALGSYGAYLAGSQEMIDYLVNRARSFIYSTALPPAVVASSLTAVELVRQSSELRDDLWRRVEVFKKCLREGGLNVDLGQTQIIPITVGASDRALRMAEALRERGVFATAVRPPTVPENTARLRFSVTRHLDKPQLEEGAQALLAVVKEFAPELLSPGV